MSKTQVEVVAGVMLDAQGRVLLMRRQSNDVPEWSEVWCHAGGKVEANEGPKPALVREWKEELGQDIRVMGTEMYARSDVSSSGVHYIVRFYPVQATDPSQQPHLSPEAIAIGWWSKAEALMLPMTPGGREIIEATM